MYYRVSTLISLALAISAFEPTVLAQEVKPSATPMLGSQTLISQYYDRTFRLRAESGPDNRGRWRFYRPNDVSEDAMRAQGCENVGGNGPQWRCPRPTIRVEEGAVDDGRSSEYNRYGRERYYGGETRRLRAESGPDNRGRWRFYRPNDVSEDTMISQGCENVGGGGPQWRCPRPTIRVTVDNGRSPYYGDGRDDGRSPYYGGRDDGRSPYYDQATRRLRAASGPDNNGRWRFYKPSDVSDDAMQGQGCTHVGTNPPDWRCPSQSVRVEVNGRR